MICSGCKLCAFPSHSSQLFSINRNEQHVRVHMICYTVYNWQKCCIFVQKKRDGTISDHNPYRTSTAKMRDIQQEQLQKFRKHAANNKWGRVHSDHFDWFMFPIEDGSVSKYNVFSGDVLELKADAAWLSGYREGVAIVAKAWGWDVAASKLIDPEEAGMGWTDWDVRLAKIIRSLWLFEQKDYLTSMQAFARVVKPRGGLFYGGICLDEVFYMT